MHKAKPQDISRCKRSCTVAAVDGGIWDCIEEFNVRFGLQSSYISWVNWDERNISYVGDILSDGFQEKNCLLLRRQCVVLISWIFKNNL